MKMVRRPFGYFLLGLIFFFVLCFHGCIGEDIIDDFVEPEVRILNSTSQIEINKQHSYEAKYFNNIGIEEDIQIQWGSSDDNIISIDTNGTATGISGGIATITASVDLNTGVVTVEETVEVPHVDPELRILNPIEEIEIGETHSYEAKYFNNNGKEQEVVILWESSEEEIISIDQDGTATALTGGTVTITASVELNNTVVTKEEIVEVPNIEPQVRILNPIEEIQIGEQHTYQAKFLNDNGIEEEVEILWESSDETIVSIDENGTATGHTGGTAMIIASVELNNGVVTGEETVIVLNVEPQVRILNPIEELQIGEQYIYQAKFFNDNGIEEEVEILWESSDETIVSIDENGTATGLTGGTVTITASVVLNSGVVTGQETVRVLNVEPEVRIQNPITELKVGNTHTYVAEYFNSNGVEEDVTVIWDSSDEGVISIDANGLATALSEGTATISVSVESDSGIVETANTVIVTQDFVDPEVRIINPIEEIVAGNTHSYEALYFNNLGVPEDVTIIWESSDANIISIDTNGLATALSEGTATLTASVETGNGTISAEETVTVTPNFVDPIVTIVNPITEIEVNNTHNYQAIYFNNLGEQENVSIVWETSDANIISIDVNGLASALSEGTVTITASFQTTNGFIKDENTVTVTPNFVDSIINIVNPISEIEVNDTHTYQAVYFNNLGEQENVSIQWESSNANIISINANGVASALSEGTATITASFQTTNGIIRDENTVTVTPNFVDPEVQILNPIAEIEVDDSHTYQAIYFNNLGQQENVQIQWSSSNENLISIDANGFATARSEGTATITASVNTTNGVVSTGDSVNIIPKEAVVSKQGTFVTTSSYLLEGSFTITENNSGGIVLDIAEDYEADTNLPGLYLYLTNNPNSVNGALEVGAVEVFSGEHRYTITNTGINDYSYLLYWCKPFTVKVGEGLIED